MKLLIDKIRKEKHLGVPVYPSVGSLYFKNPDLRASIMAYMKDHLIEDVMRSEVFLLDFMKEGVSLEEGDMIQTTTIHISPGIPYTVPYPHCFFDLPVCNVLREKMDIAHLGVYFNDLCVDEKGIETISFFIFSQIMGTFKGRKYLLIGNISVSKEIPLEQDSPFLYSSTLAPILPEDTEWEQKIKEGMNRFNVHVVKHCLFILQMLSCKNVRSEPEVIDPPLAKAFQKRHGFPMSEYRVLKVRVPSNRAPTQKAQREDQGSSYHVRQHLCRGHFATYIPEAPLFGKHVGSYWIPAHIKGDPSLGTIKKTYEVSTA